MTIATAGLLVFGVVGLGAALGLIGPFKGVVGAFAGLAAAFVVAGGVK